MWAALASIAMGGRLQTSTRSSAELCFHGLIVSNTICAQRWPELCRLLLKTHITSKKTWKHWLHMFIYSTNFLLKYSTFKRPQKQNIILLKNIIFWLPCLKTWWFFKNNLLHSFPTVTVTTKHQVFFKISPQKKLPNNSVCIPISEPAYILCI